MLSDKIEYYQTTKTELKNTPAQYKKEFEWLKEVDSLALANVQQQLRGAYNKFFKQGLGFPKFKKKGQRDSYTTNNQKGTVAITHNSVKLPKITPLSTYFSKVLVYLVFKISVKTIRILNSIKIKSLR